MGFPTSEPERPSSAETQAAGLFRTIGGIGIVILQTVVITLALCSIVFSAWGVRRLSSDLFQFGLFCSFILALPGGILASFAMPFGTGNPTSPVVLGAAVAWAVLVAYILAMTIPFVSFA